MGIKRSYCQYSNEPTDDAGVESVKIYLPTKNGYIQYNLVHSVLPNKQCDTWRLGPAYHCNDEFTEDELLTRPRAEWEMAIRLRDRCDFIGGAAHGDEVFESISVWINGAERSLSTMCELTPFETLAIRIDSVGFDPDAPGVQVLEHRKTVSACGDRLWVDQRVRWLADALLGQSYLAMMPPLKTLTKRYRAGNTAYQPITVRSFTDKGQLSSLTLQGDSGYTFTMSVPKYLSDGERNTFIITDNGGDQYHKMYFVLCHSGAAHAGDCWETTTVYRIEK